MVCIYAPPAEADILQVTGCLGLCSDMYLISRLHSYTQIVSHICLMTLLYFGVFKLVCLYYIN